MADGVYIDIRGLKDLQKVIGNKTDAVIKEIDNRLSGAAEKYADLVVQSIHNGITDEGTLASGVSAKHKGVLEHEVVSNADYSANVEFGTKDKRSIPPDLAAYAKQFRGKGKNSGKGLFEKILAWVKRKGIAGRFSVKTRRKLNSRDDQEREYQAARAIYYSILEKGIKAQPFFFKHRKAVYAQLQKELGPAIKKALAK